MSDGRVQEAAVAAIGKDDPDSDWNLRPQEHAKSLPPQAGALARVLHSDAVRQIMARFTEADARANAVQAHYKKRSRQAIFARLGAILIGGLFLLPISDAGMAGAFALKLGLFLQYGCLTIALALAAYLSVRRLFARWMEGRADAELARLALFEMVMTATEPVRDGELPLLPLKLEYFRRYQLDVQTRYYLGRGTQHQHAAGQTKRTVLILNIASVLAFLPLIVVGAEMVGLLHFQTLLPYFAFLALGTAISGVLAALAAISSMNLDERNAARYLVVHE
ncbi:MAG: hypothetical protein WBP94_20440, partial [Rhodomicrobiaceae bacterium]